MYNNIPFLFGSLFGVFFFNLISQKLYVFTSPAEIYIWEYHMKNSSARKTFEWEVFFLEEKEGIFVCVAAFFFYFSLALFSSILKRLCFFLLHWNLGFLYNFDCRIQKLDFQQYEFQRMPYNYIEIHICSLHRQWSMECFRRNVYWKSQRHCCSLRSEARQLNLDTRHP